MQPQPPAARANPTAAAQRPSAHRSAMLRPGRRSSHHVRHSPQPSLRPCRPRAGRPAGCSRGLAGQLRRATSPLLRRIASGAVTPRTGTGRAARGRRLVLVGLRRNVAPTVTTRLVEIGGLATPHLAGPLLVLDVLDVLDV